MTNDINTTWASKILFFLLCATLVFTAAAYGTVHQPIISIMYIISVIIVALWAIDSLKTGFLRFNRNLIQIPVIAIIIYGFIQIIPFGTAADIAGVSGIGKTISLDPFWTRQFTFHLIAFFIFLAAMLTYIDTAKRLRKVVWLITIFGFIFAFFAILQNVLSPGKIFGIYEPEFAEPYGTFVNRHNFAAYMEMTIAVPLGLLFAGAIPKDKRLLFITAVGLMGVALLLSGSRGGFVSLLAAIFFLIILTTETKSYGRLGLKIGLAVLLVGTIIAGAILIGGESSLTRIAETAASDNITTNRTHIWNITLSVIKTYPIFGTGLGGYAAAYTNFDTMNGAMRVEQAHNDYLQILTDAGLIGLVIAAFFVFQLFRNGLRNAKESNLFNRGIVVGALAGCFAILVHSLFDFVLHTSAVTYLFITLVALVAVSGNKFPDEDEIEYSRRQKKRRTANVTPIEAKRKK
ncbi:MAG: O-antigen ligase family protein [Pyrinomonadaceae bacterium]